MNRYSRVHAEIDLDAILHNMDAMRGNIAKDTKIMAVIKADGYGHGAVEIAETIEKLDYLYGCTAVCTAGNLTEFNFRKVHTLVRRGEYQGAYEEMNKCMLCGKCRLVCPRGINTRGVVMLIKRKLGDF